MQTNTSQIQMQKIRTNRNKGPDRFCGKLPTSNLKVPIEQKICQPVSPITLDMCEETVVELSTVDSSIDSPSLSGMYSKNGTIGLRGLPLQVERRTRRLGGLFNLMVVGSPGCGKSTLINTLFGEVLLPESKPSISTGIRRHKFKLSENGFDLNLTLFNVPKYGAEIDNSYAWLPLKNFIEAQYQQYLFQSEQPNRLQRTDSRIHCCLYFIKPTGHSEMCPLDVIALKALCTCVNIIPIVAKCDTFDKQELLKFKEMIRLTLKENKITICESIGCDFDEDGMPPLKSISDSAPFAIIGSTDRHENARGVHVRGRLYKWGLAEVDNEDHCDFLHMRHLLMEEHMLDLVLSTKTFYNEYRKVCLQSRWNKASENSNVDMLNGISQYFKYTRITQDALESPTSISKAMYEEGLHQFNMKREKVIAACERRIKSWRKTLEAKQANLNKDVEREYQRLDALKAQVKKLEEQAQEVYPLRRNVSEIRLASIEKKDIAIDIGLEPPKSMIALQRFATTF